MSSGHVTDATKGLARTCEAGELHPGDLILACIPGCAEFLCRVLRVRRNERGQIRVDLMDGFGSVYFHPHDKIRCF
ncbi:hypothetical protein [Stenotrophomonas sp. CFBP8980]|uniref:hypothetical protein n=1 Tax=Stenotrophomonas sp. CFBP8980 TaxID=3096523 RepID=UPI002A6A6B10|nr:hypothetical protein [Stenotrophomonas sp. CFBP8980]MDY1035184.1 hypothetical protein [Stenotrophomonas sp. CFBP8980]